MTAERDTRGLLSKNRAEELGYDVWEHFVLPPFFRDVDFSAARKPQIIIGGRGCGKTMLLRYLSHQSAFSPKRTEIPPTAVAQIGLYWRVDTQFASAMAGRGVESDVWDGAFRHLTALVLGAEILSSLESVAASRCPALSSDELERVSLGRLRAFDPSLGTTVDALRSQLEERLWQVEAWVNDVRKKPEPSFLPGKPFLEALVNEVRAKVPAMDSTTFLVYLDEYENLSEQQQRIVNTWLKHSEEPLIFNLAMKRPGLAVQETTGTETLADIHDYRRHDLEEYYEKNDFQAFAAEILLLRLSQALAVSTGVEPASLRDDAHLAGRATADYKRQVIAHARKLFPGLTQKELAESIFADPALKRRLKDRVELALQRRKENLPSDLFLRESLPEASTVVPALLHRPRLKPSAVAKELDKLAEGVPNRFTGRTGWVHNNFVGCLLQIYEPLARPCPLYSGFDTFCALAHGNLRHFLELAYKSLSGSLDRLESFEPSVSPDKQAEAARQASAAFIGEIRSFGAKGNQLHMFVLRLGSLLQLSHRRPSQSESEQTHFTVTTGALSLTDGDHAFLREAVKWSVLFEEPATKRKEKWVPEGLDFVPNPIYAPYFHISYRKKRKLELSTGDLICILRGNLDGFSQLMRKYRRRWGVGVEELESTQYSLLADEA